MKIFKILFDIVRYLVYAIASWIAVDKIYGIVFPEKVKTE